MKADDVADRKVMESVQNSLDVKMVVVKDLASWKPGVDSKVEELTTTLRDLQDRVNRLAVKIEEYSNPAHKVFDTKDLDLTKSMATHLAAPSLKATSGLKAMALHMLTGDLVKGWSPPLCLPRSQVRNNTLVTLQYLSLMVIIVMLGCLLRIRIGVLYYLS